MASTAKSADKDDAPLIDLNEASVKKLMSKAKKKGYITLDELNEALPTDMDSDQIEDVQTALSEMGVQIVENDEEAEAEAEADAEVEEMEVDEGDKKKWLGNGQICAGGCCPCMHNKGDWGEISAETDGSTPEKYGSFYAVSPFWPPCITNTVVFHLTQKGVGPPNKKGGSPAIVEMAR